MQEGEELEDAADAESCESNEASTVSGDNDGKCLTMLTLRCKCQLQGLTTYSLLSVSLDETSSNASCSAESQSKGLSTARESYRAASQVGGCIGGTRTPLQVQVWSLESVGWAELMAASSTVYSLCRCIFFLVLAAVGVLCGDWVWV